MPETIQLAGEVVFDPATESEFQAGGCLLLLTSPGGYELVLPDGWRAFHDEEGVRVADPAGHRLTRSYYAAFFEAIPLDGQGCKGATPVLLLQARPPPANVGTVFVEAATLPGGGMYIEGSIGIIRIEDGEGKLLAQQPAEHGSSFALPAGAATLISYQKACDMNCSMGASGYLDVCEVRLDRARVELTITVLLRPGEGCTIEYREGRPADLVGLLRSGRLPASALYPGETCAFIEGMVLVPPYGWTLRSLRQGRSLELVDPAGTVVGHDGDILWLNGTEVHQPSPFGCAGETRFDMTDMVKSRKPS